MKDPISGFFLSLIISIAVGAVAMMLTVPHPKSTYVHRLKTDGTTHVECGECGHRIREKNEDDLMRLWKYTQIEALPRLRG